MSTAKDPLLKGMLKRVAGGAQDVMTGTVKARFVLYADRADVLESLSDGNVIVTLGSGKFRTTR